MDEPTWKKRGCGTQLLGFLVALAVVVAWLVWLALLVAVQATP